MENLKINLLQGRYQEVAEKCQKLDADGIRDMIMTIAYETESICVYSFIQYMIEKTKKTNWMELAVDVMLNPLCFVEGAYSAALFHSRELLAVERSVENLERIIFFYEIPEKLVEEEEARCIAKEILKAEPDNKAALNV